MESIEEEDENLPQAKDITTNTPSIIQPTTKTPNNNNGHH
jgi:hypothetical protein